MNKTAQCCHRQPRLAAFGLRRGLCIACAGSAARARRESTLGSANEMVDVHIEFNPVGCLRLYAWQMRREWPGGFRFEQGPGACAALLTARR